MLYLSSAPFMRSMSLLEISPTVSQSLMKSHFSWWCELNMLKLKWLLRIYQNATLNVANTFSSCLSFYEYIVNTHKYKNDCGIKGSYVSYGTHFLICTDRVSYQSRCVAGSKYTYPVQRFINKFNLFCLFHICWIK